MYDHEALERALYGRLKDLKGTSIDVYIFCPSTNCIVIDLPEPYKLHCPRIYHTNVEFVSSKLKMEGENKRTVIPSGTSKWTKAVSLLFIPDILH